MAKKLVSTVKKDAATAAASDAFEYEFNGTGTPFIEPTLPQLPPGWRLGLLVGPSGSGKSTVLRGLCEREKTTVHKCECLGGEGDIPPPPLSGTSVWPVDAPALSSIPGGEEALRPFGEAVLDAASRRPFHLLSRGERSILALARLCVQSDSDFMDSNVSTMAHSSVAERSEVNSALSVADEFTSYVDRPSAATISRATHTAWKRRSSSERLVCASVHEDVLTELMPDWCYDTRARKLTVFEWDPQDLPRELPDDAERHLRSSSSAASAGGVPGEVGTMDSKCEGEE